MITLANEFFSLNEFAQTAIYMEVSGSNITKPIPVIYDSEDAVHTLNGITFSQDKPTCMCKASDVENATNNSIIKIDGWWYTVLEVANDGLGVTTLTLSEDRIHGK